MKKSLNRLLFSFRIAAKSLIRTPLKTLLLFIGFIGVFVVILLTFSMRGFLETYYEGNIKETYQSFDLVMDASNDSDSRFFSLSSYDQNDILQSMVDDEAKLFRFSVLTYLEDDASYVDVIASSLEDFKKISTLNQSFNTQLLDQEVIITKSYADQYGFVIGDEISLKVNQVIKNYEIVHIIEDGHLFKESSIYIDKDHALHFFLTIMIPGLDSFPPTILNNIYNQVYIDIDEGENLEQVMDHIKSIEAYEQLNVSETYRALAIQQFIQRNFSIFLIILLIVFIAMMLALRTTIVIHFNSKKKLFINIQLLGGHKSFSFIIVFLELIILLILAYIGSIWVTGIIINQGLNYLNAYELYELRQMHIILSGLIGLMILCVVFMSIFLKYQDFNLTENMHKRKTYKQRDIYLYVSLAMLSLLLWGILYTFDLIPIDIEAAFTILFGLVFIYAIIQIWMTKSSIKNNHQKIAKYQLKMMKNEQSFMHFMHMMLIVFTSVLLLVFANDYMQKRSMNYQDEYQTDLVMTQITRNYEGVYERTLLNQEVLSAEKVILYRDVKNDAYQQNISELISMNPDKISTYFNLDIDEASLNDLKDMNKTHIILPDRYHYLYDFKVGDDISLYVNGKVGVIDFYIVGFFEKELGNLAFTNYQLNETSYNVIFVNAKSDKELLKNQLISEFSDEIIKIIDVKVSMDKLIADMASITTYITFVLSFMIVCFMIVLFNHMTMLFFDMKHHYAKLIVLGIRKKQMILTLISAFSKVFIIAIIMSFLAFILIADQIAFVTLLFNDYEPVKVLWTPIIKGLLILGVIYTLIIMIYVRKVTHMNYHFILRQF